MILTKLYTKGELSTGLGDKLGYTGYKLASQFSKAEGKVMWSIHSNCGIAITSNVVANKTKTSYYIIWRF